MKPLFGFVFLVICFASVRAEYDTYANVDYGNYPFLRTDEEDIARDATAIVDSEHQDDVMTNIIGLLVEAARSTSYSSLLTLNVTNVIILAVLAFIFFSNFGFISLGRSFDGTGTLDVSAISSAVSFIAPTVRTALEIYDQLQEH